MKKYYIVKISPLYPVKSIWHKQYKRYKCIDGFSPNKDICWKFTKQGATKIIERLKREYPYNGIEFMLEEAAE